jgi:hypothetical protein
VGGGGEVCGMKQALMRIFVFLAWPAVALLMLAGVTVVLLGAWVTILFTPVRFEGGKIKVGTDASS